MEEKSFILVFFLFFFLVLPHSNLLDILWASVRGLFSYFLELWEDVSHRNSGYRTRGLSCFSVCAAGMLSVFREEF